jgi:hypothetical protein
MDILDLSYKSLEELTTSMAIMVSVSLCYLLWGLFLYLKLYFGIYNVNKLSFMPFKWAFIDLSSNLLACISVVVAVNQVASGAGKSTVPLYFYYPLVTIQSFSGFAFIITIFYEETVLFNFVLWQGSIDHTQLDQKRTLFNQMERFVDWTWNVSYAVCALVDIVLTVTLIASYNQDELRRYKVEFIGNIGMSVFYCNFLMVSIVTAMSFLISMRTF